MTNPMGFGPGGDNDGLASMFENIGRMLRNGGKDGDVDWSAAQSACDQLIASHPCPAVTESDQSATNNASTIAEIWLNQATSFSSAHNSVRAITPQEWTSLTFEAWKAIVEPVAAAMASAMSSIMPSNATSEPTSIPEEVLEQMDPGMADQMREMLQSVDFSALSGSLIAMARSMGATMFGTQFGGALGEMAQEILSTTDTGIPLTDTSSPTVVLANVHTLAEGLGKDVEEVKLYVILRELAHQRLFEQAPWIHSQVVEAIHAYSRGVKIDTARIEQAMTDVDLSNPNSLNELMQGNIFEPSQSDEQRFALDRLEVLLALIEGWVTVVVTDATHNRLPSAMALEETFRRRRAAGGPAEKLFAGLVGLEIRPRRIREAVTLWNRITSSNGIDARDNVWSHPDLLPNAADLEDSENYTLDRDYDLMADLNRAMDESSGAPDPHESEKPED